LTHSVFTFELHVCIFALKVQLQHKLRRTANGWDIQTGEYCIKIAFANYTVVYKALLFFITVVSNCLQTSTNCHSIWCIV